MSEKENKALVSVAVITYNQQDTIAQTLDSILMQKGDFELELVVGEDCSTDNTWNICQDYASRYPDIVRLLPNRHNLGIMGNFARVVKACSGGFVAMCAGDDYWCDEHKLQKQLGFFNQHPDYGVVSTSGSRKPFDTPCDSPSSSSRGWQCQTFLFFSRLSRWGLCDPIILID